MLVTRGTVFFLSFAFKLALATTFVMHPDQDTIGKVHYLSSQEGETLEEAGLRADMGQTEMVAANPGVPANQMLTAGQRLKIPDFYILPQGPREGIIINLAEFRLYYFPGDNTVLSMPVSIGRHGWDTPLGLTKIIQKERNPIWRPTSALQKDARDKGVIMPEAFPGGEGNPLGHHALKLAWPTYLIHGTNNRRGIGLPVSAGCIRMLAEDVEFLFDMVKVGTTVRIINAPIKLGQAKGHTYLEVHGASSRKHWPIELQQFIQAHPDKEKLILKELHRPTGIPLELS